MLPKKRLNIYPKTDENINAILDFYFNDCDIEREGALERLRKAPLSINQIEFMMRKISEAMEPIFLKNLKSPVLTNLIKYGIDALLIGECKSGSKPRKQITLEFREFVTKTEIDFQFLERNN